MQGDGSHLVDTGVVVRRQHRICMFVLASESDKNEPN